MAIQVQTDDRIRLTASVLLLTKFVEENPGFKPHPLKTATLEHLIPHADHPCAVASREIAEACWMSAFYGFAVGLHGPRKRFGPREGVLPFGGDPRFLQWLKPFPEKNYACLLGSFYEDAAMGPFWEGTAALWEEVAADCRACLEDCGLERFLELLFGSSPLGLTLVPNPLDPPTFGFGPNDGETIYAIYGPPTVPLDTDRSVSYSGYGSEFAYLAFHEFSHTLWDKAREQHPAAIEQTAPLEAKMKLTGWFPEMYETWDIRFDEIFIRAATALYHEYLEGEAAAQAALDREKRDFGIDLVEPVFLCLRDYLAARERGEYRNLGEYLPVLAASLTES